MLLFNLMYKLKNHQLFLVSIFLLGVSVPAAFAQSEVDLGRAMSAEEFSAAGLDKLTADELRELALWIKRYREQPLVNTPTDKSNASVETPAEVVTIPPAPVAPQTAGQDSTSRFGQEQVEREIPAAEAESIASRLNGEFRGWTGNTVFRLENGQVWRQRVGGKYRSALRTNPEVVVERGRFGYYLKLVESGRSVGVKRVR